VSAIYITLTRLEGKGLVSSWMGAPTDARGGKAKRHFKVAPAGLAALNETKARLLSMWAGIEDALGVAGKVAYAD
jgi:PadR family transcriptional regulator PadR